MFVFVLVLSLCCVVFVCGEWDVWVCRASGENEDPPSGEWWEKQTFLRLPPNLMGATMAFKIDPKLFVCLTSILAEASLQSWKLRCAPDRLLASLWSVWIPFVFRNSATPNVVLLHLSDTAKFAFGSSRGAAEFVFKIQVL